MHEKVLGQNHPGAVEALSMQAAVFKEQVICRKRFRAVAGRGRNGADACGGFLWAVGMLIHGPRQALVRNYLIRLPCQPALLRVGVVGLGPFLSSLLLYCPRDQGIRLVN